MKPKIPNATVGVIIGRFQVPDLHPGHCALFDSVIAKHKKVLILVGSTPGVMVTQKNPLDFFTRKMMIAENYPNVMVLPVFDMPCDDNWSRSVDARVKEAFGDHLEANDVVLYGSRDAFIPHYHGMFQTIELEPSVDISGTQVREAASNEVRQHSEFRRGVVYAAYNRHPVMFKTVDIAVIKRHPDTQEPQSIVLGRKSSDPEGQWRFPGGFVDPRRDNSLKAAARREAGEELGQMEFGELEYADSVIVDDWRYRNEVDKIMTSVFVADYGWGPLKAGDDLDDAKLFSLADFNEEILVPQHRPLMNIVFNHLEKERNSNV